MFGCYKYMFPSFALSVYSTMSSTKRMIRSMRFCFLFLFLVQLLPYSTALSRDWVKIKATDQSIKLVDMFLFEKTGGVDLWIYNITFTSTNSNPIVTPNIHHLSQMGFYLSPRGTKGAELLKQYDKHKSLCYLHSRIGGSKKIIYTLDKLERTNQFNTSKEFEIKPGYYSLLFENCVPNVEVSMHSSSGMYNLDGSGSRHYSNWWTNITSRTVYSVFLSFYVVAALCWCWYYTDSTSILEDSCNLVTSFRCKLLMLLSHVLCTFAIDRPEDPRFVAINWWFANILMSLFIMRMLLYLQTGSTVRRPVELRMKEEVLGYLVCVALIILWSWEAYTTLEPCDAYSLDCFFRLNAIRCARSFVMILMLYMAWKDNTDDASVQVTKLLIVPRSNLFFFTLLFYYVVMHFSFLLGMFPSTFAVAAACEESANLALFVFICYLYWPRPSSDVGDDGLEANLINSQP